MRIKTIPPKKASIVSISLLDGRYNADNQSLPYNYTKNIHNTTSATSLDVYYAPFVLLLMVSSETGHDDKVFCSLLRHFQHQK